MLSLNVQSIRSKFDSLALLIAELANTELNFSVICLQETWLTDNCDISLLQLENYTCISQGKRCCGHGGLMIYVHKQFPVTQDSISINSAIWEGLTVTVSGGGLPTPLSIFNVYKPPKENNTLNIESFINEISPILQNYAHKKNPIILLGDFNIDLLKVTEKPLTVEFLDMLMSLNLYPQITLPTRFSTRNCTLIDNIFCDLLHIKSDSSSGILFSEISDH